jgi:hypothetical protein
MPSYVRAGRTKQDREPPVFSLVAPRRAWGAVSPENVDQTGPWGRPKSPGAPLGFAFPPKSLPTTPI